MKADLTYARFIQSRCQPLIQAIRLHGQAMFSSSDPHHLHQLRVSSRRLRNTLDVFDDILTSRHAKSWKRSIKTLGRVLSAARDLDVQVQFLNNMLPQQTRRVQRQFFRGLICDFVAQRKRFQPRILAAIHKIEAEQTLNELEANLTQRASRDQRPFRFLYTTARLKILQRVDKLLAYEPHVDHARAVDLLHKMRIANKRLRYSLETLRPVYSREIDGFLEKILFYHRTLGKMHDFDIWLLFLSRSKDLSRPLGDRQSLLAFREYCHQHRHEYYELFRAAWHRDRQQDMLEDLLSYLTSAALFPPETKGELHES